MKVSPLTLLLIGLALGGLAFGSCQGARASEATLKLEALLASRDSAAAHWTVERHALTEATRRLRGDSTMLHVALVRTQASRDGAQRESQRLATRLQAAGDTAGARVVRVADSTAQAERQGCSLVVLNCEARAENAEERAAGDSILLAQTHTLLVQTEAAWHIEQQRNRPGLFGLRRFWQARAWTVPLAAVTALLLLRR